MLRQAITVLALMPLLVVATKPKPDTSKKFRQVWSEEFDPCDDKRHASSCVNGLRASIWSFEEGDGTKYGPDLRGWGNNEMQCYTKRSRNVRVLSEEDGARGVLAITATFHDDGTDCFNPGAANSTRYWSSARIMTRGKVAFGFDSQAVKFEARVKVPQEWGAWPAFWLLPNTNRTDCIGCGDFGNAWCISGEVDILESRNKDATFQSTLHYGGLKETPWTNCTFTTGTLPVGRSAHYWNRVSAVMGPTNISFFVNDTLVHSVPSSTWYTGAVDKSADPLAPFNRPFYMLLNLAVGGNYPAQLTNGHMITDTAHAPYRYLIDWVRVYREVSASSTGGSSDGARRALRDQ